jgi:hypothetical protein
METFVREQHATEHPASHDVAALLGCDSDAIHDAIISQLNSRLLLLPEDWQLEVSESGVNGAGAGVHLRGHCAAGTVLCSYPGTVFRPEDLPLMHQMVLPGNAYVVARRDGVLLDGRPDGPSLQIREMARQRDAAKRRAASAAVPCECVRNFAIGHRINHPPAGLLPNAIIFPFDLHEGEHTCLHPLLDVFHFRPPAEGDPIKQSAVFIATRPLRDEELFLDYKLNMQGPLEAWYSRVVYPAAKTNASAAAHRGVQHPHAALDHEVQV